jgi:hypothetical protein
MKTNSAILLLLLSLMPAPSAEPAWTNVVNVSEVDPRSVSLIRPDLPQPNVIFDFVSKSPQEVRAIVRQHQGAPVLVMKDGHVLAKAPGCTGHLGPVGADKHLDYVGLVLVFDSLDEARRAEKALKHVDEKKQ